MSSQNEDKISKAALDYMRKEIAKVDFNDEKVKKINEIFEKNMIGKGESFEKREEEFFNKMPKVPDEDTEFLNKKLSSLPPDHVFTDEELDEIATKGFPGLEKAAYITVHETEDPNSFDRRERLHDKTDEEIITFCERYAGKDHKTPIFKNFYNLCMGFISSREYHHNINKRTVIKKFKAIHKIPH